MKQIDHRSSPLLELDVAPPANSLRHAEILYINLCDNVLTKTKDM